MVLKIRLVGNIMFSLSWCQVTRGLGTWTDVAQKCTLTIGLGLQNH